MNIKLTSILNSFLILFFLSSCGGIGGTGGTVEEDDVVSLTKRTVTGLISQKKSSKSEIVVSGDTFRLNGSVIKRNDVDVFESTLSVGQRVTIDAVDSDGDGVFDAKEIVVDESLVGPILKIDNDNKTMNILGVTVKISEMTIFSGRKFKDLEKMNMVAVFGDIDSSGNVEASLIEFLKSEFDEESDTVEFEGRFDFSSLPADSSSSTNLVSEDINGDVDSDNFEVRTTSAGELVEIEGVKYSELLGILNGYRQPDGSAAEVTDKIIDKSRIVIEGYIYNFEAGEKFSVGGVEVITKDYTGAEVFVSGDYVKVIGVYNKSGLLILDSIVLRRLPEFSLTAKINSYDSEDRLIQVFGTSLKITENTFLGLDEDELVEGVKVYISGYKGDDGELKIRVLVEADSVSNNLVGLVDQIDESSLSVSGFGGQYDSSAIFVDSLGQPLSINSENLVLGMHVSVTFKENEGSFLISEINEIVRDALVEKGMVLDGVDDRGLEGIPKRLLK